MLNSLLLCFDGKDEDEVIRLGRGLYKRLYIGDGREFGIINNHFDELVFFWEDQFEHAFFTSSNRARYPDRKDKFAIDRLERIHWIFALISGEVPGSECWHVPAKTGRTIPPNCIYILWDPFYVVWLEPRRKGGWKFSTAYLTGSSDLRRYCKGGKKVWSAPKK